MKTIYEYSIQNFTWSKKDNTFYGTAWDLIPNDPYEGFDPFPNGREQFVIRNESTHGFRRFRFVKEETVAVKFEPGDMYSYIDDNMYAPSQDTYYETTWIYESEDGIKCRVDVGISY